MSKYKEFDDMAKRDEDMTLYSQSNAIAAYINMIKFAIEKIELYVDEIGDEVFFGGDMSAFPEDVLGDDSLFAEYTNPWDPDDDDEFDEFGAFYTPAQAGCDCDDCRCRNADAKVKLGRMSVGNIMDILNKTRKAPQDYRMD